MWPRSLCAAALTFALWLGLGVAGCDDDGDDDGGASVTSSEGSSGSGSGSASASTTEGATDSSGAGTSGSASTASASASASGSTSGTGTETAAATTAGSTDTSNSATDTAATSTDGTEGTGTTDGTGGSGAVTPPAEAAALLEYLRTGEYRQWRSEPATHPSEGPHFGDVRIYVNDALFDSLNAGSTTHPVGSAAIKELYGSGPNVRGWAVEIKTGDEPDGDGWYWYERYDGDVYAQSNGAGICTGCHSDGTDFVFVQAAALQ